MKIQIASLLLFFSFAIHAQNTNYIEGQIIVKIKSQFNSKCNKSSIDIPSIEKLVTGENIGSVEKMFPNHERLTKKKGQEKFVDLSTIYTFQFDPSLDERKILNQLRKNPSVQYAELNYLNELAYSPNDSLNGQQWYLSAVNLFQAWDIQQGDTSVVIAIVDTGSDLDHEDLVDNFAYNYDDPVNGLDDDNDGYIDNFNGWDLASNDNDVTFGVWGHGTNVAGIASASTDNGKGMSGGGFNTKILTARIDDAAGRLTAAYQGIVYSADQGAFVINNSWGSPQFSAFAEDIVNYAAINKGCLVIAATGNDGMDQKFYPAAYENVLSVGSMFNEDTVKQSSNYGYWVDLFAPGESMFTCAANGLYQRNGGTSMASPLVAGIAGLVKSQFPNYTWEQVAEQMRNAGEDIYAMNDPQYTDRLGFGRINAFKAVSSSSKPGIKFIDRSITDNNDNSFALGDTIRISGAFKNFINTAKNASASISVIDNKLDVLTPSISLGDINELDSVSIRSTPFEMIVKPGMDFNETVDIVITITADNYVKRQYLELVANVDFITISENNLTVSVGGDGGIGFSGDGANLGAGIKHLNGNSHLFEGGFIVGNSPFFLSNKFRGNSNNRDLDFNPISPAQRITPKIADVETVNKFDNRRTVPTFPLEITNTNYVFKHDQALNSIIYEYRIENTGSSAVNNLYAGLIIDWDIASFAANKVGYVSSKKMGVSFSTDTAIFCGVRVLTDSIDAHHFAIDNVGDSATNGGLNITDGFSDEEKFRVISSQRNIGGASSDAGNDILDVNSVGPFSLKSGESKSIAFSITISGDLDSLKLESDTLKRIYERIVISVPSIENKSTSNQLTIAPNPVKDRLRLNVKYDKSVNAQVNIYDINGRIVYTQNGLEIYRGEQDLNLSVENWKTGIYLVEIRGKNLLLQEKFVLAQ